MKLLKNNSKSTEILLSIDELLTIHQSLNEICNGIDVFEFQTRIGVSREEVVELMKEFATVINITENN
ncbi:MAG: hypothetical protein JSR46_07615 [Verrucomicrobia bacterium]|nr:hypothetical protein [Verrucomicrobiota bacterium]